MVTPSVLPPHQRPTSLGVRLALTVGGIAAVSTGLLVLVAGASALPGEQLASPTVDNELRFFAAFWLAYGVVVLRAAPRAASEPDTVRSLALVLLVAGAGRAVSWIAVGQPHPLFAALTIVELAAAPVLLVWQERIRAAR